MTAMDEVREYDPITDAKRLRQFVVELQEFARRLEPGLPEGPVMADAYVASILARCAKWRGRIFFAQADGEPVGFVCVWAKMPPQEADEDQSEHAFISDLYVAAAHRGRGLGRQLLQRAEAYAREYGATVMKIGVLAKNRNARHLYEAVGFAEYHLHLRKRL